MILTTVYIRGGQTFFSDGPNFIKILYCGPQKNFFALFFLHKDHIIDANFGYFIHKCVINSLVVHSKFETEAAENLLKGRTLATPGIYHKVSIFYE